MAAASGAPAEIDSRHERNQRHSEDQNRADQIDPEGRVVVLGLISEEVVQDVPEYEGQNEEDRDQGDRGPPTTGSKYPRV